MRSTPPPSGSRLLPAALVAGLLASPLACGEAPPPPPAVPETPVASVAAPPPAPAPVDLAPVAEPADIVLVARWKNPSATFSGLSTCSAVPSKLVTNGVKHLIDRALADAFHNGVDGRALGEIIALDAPVDLVASLDTGRQPGAFVAFSIPLISMERAKGVLDGAGPLNEVQPGFYRLGTREDADLSCAVGPAAGNAPARLICGPRDKDLAALGPYLTRNLPTATSAGQDVHVELRVAPIDARYGADLRRYIGLLPALARSQSINQPAFDRALGEAADALTTEGPALLADLDRMTIDLGVDDASCLTAKAVLDLRGKSSWVAGMLADRSTRTGPPPAMFWRAPVDSESASYGRGSDVGKYEGVFRALRGFVEGRLAQEQVGSDADRKALVALLASPIGKNTSFVMASGHDHGSKKAAAAPPPGGRPDDNEMIAAYLGWYLFGFDEGPSGLGKLLKDVVAVYGRKGLVDPLKKQVRDADRLPTLKLVPAPPKLGRGALDLEIGFPPSRHADAKDAKKKEGLKAHVLLMADGQTTWLAMGTDRDELVKRLVGVKAGAPEAGTLATRPGLEPLRAPDAFSNGFFTLGLLTQGAANVLQNPLLIANAGSKASMLAEVTNTLTHLPHGGGTPIFVTSTTTGAGAHTELSLRMQKGSFEDVGAVVNLVLRIANLPGLRP